MGILFLVFQRQIVRSRLSSESEGTAAPGRGRFPSVVKSGAVYESSNIFRLASFIAGYHPARGSLHGFMALRHDTGIAGTSPALSGRIVTRHVFRHFHP